MSNHLRLTPDFRSAHTSINMEAIAKLRNVPTSPRKMRLVADSIRGKQVNKALNILKFETKSGGAKIEQLLLSAIANWQVKYEDVKLEEVDLYVKTIFVDGGAMLKRLRPAPQGRGHRIRKRSNHITIIVDAKLINAPVLATEQVEEVAPAKKKSTPKSDTANKKK